MKRYAKLFLLLFIFFILSGILVMPIKSYAKESKYLVLIETKKGEWKAYDNLAWQSKDKRVVVNLINLAKKLGFHYTADSKNLTITNGEKSITYNKNSLNYSAAPYTSLKELTFTPKYYSGKSGLYKDLGYKGIICYSTVKLIRAFPEIKLGENNMENYFYQSKISDELFQRIDGKSYKKNCTVPLEDLRYLRVLYFGFDNETHIGEILVNKSIAKDTLQIFCELYKNKYPIEKMQLIDEYNADDNASMTDNNTSAFNFRYIDGTNKYSNHALGKAIDINPLYNPYVRTKNGKKEVLPSASKKYADRSLKCRYYIKKDDFCYNVFKKYGFTWGGSWNSSKDYQHFEHK